MIKLINSIIAIFLGISMVNAQHLIITNINDTIEAKIISKDDSIYTYKRLQKPKIEKQIATKNVVRLIPIGDDTLFNTFITINQNDLTNEEKLNPAYKKQNYNINEVIVLDSTQTKDYLFDKAQKFIALNFKNSQRVIQLSDRISGSIICKGTMKTYIKGLLGYTSPGYMHYTLSVSVKNGKYKIEVNQVEYAATSPSCIGLSNFQIENSKSPCGLWGADWEYVKENYLIEMNSFLEYFKKEMARPANEDW